MQNGRARILDDRCIDCGRCLIACPHHAMMAETTPMSALAGFRMTVAIPSPALYSQFRGTENIQDINRRLRTLGFDAIYDEGKASEILAEALNRYLHRSDITMPVISSSCPVIPRLVLSLYPSLQENLSPFVSSAELAARIAKREAAERFDLPQADIGVFYISPCAAQMTHILAPTGITESALDGVLSMRRIYGEMVRLHDVGDETPVQLSDSGAYGMSAAVVGGLSAAVGTSRYLAVDGMTDVLQCLDEIDEDRLSSLKLFEACACDCGCVGGSLVFENKYVAKNHNRRLANSRPRLDPASDEQVQKYIDSPLLWCDAEYKPRTIGKLSPDMGEAIRMMDELSTICQDLPGLDCGSCGSPSCHCLAEDIVRGHATELNCIFKLRDKVREMAQEMVDLAESQANTRKEESK